MLKTIDRLFRALVLNMPIAAITAAEVGSGRDTKVFDVTATADADTFVDIPHGMSSTPVIVYFTPIQVKGTTSSWYVAAIGATNVRVQKNSVAAGSGDAGAQVRVVIKRRTHLEA